MPRPDFGLVNATQDLVDARRRASKAAAQAALAHWPLTWPLRLWAALLGVLEARALAKVRKVRRRLLGEADEISAGHRAPRARAYREAQERKGHQDG